MKREDDIITTTIRQLIKDGKYQEGSGIGWFNFKGRLGCWYQAKDAIEELESMIEYAVSNEDFLIASVFKSAIEEIKQYFIDENIDVETIYN